MLYRTLVTRQHAHEVKILSKYSISKQISYKLTTANLAMKIHNSMAHSSHTLSKALLPQHHHFSFCKQTTTPQTSPSPSYFPPSSPHNLRRLKILRGQHLTRSRHLRTINLLIPQHPRARPVFRAAKRLLQRIFELLSRRLVERRVVVVVVVVGRFRGRRRCVCSDWLCGQGLVS
jgi:sulfite reductase alpha subunit-like flavoprotein